MPAVEDPLIQGLGLLAFLAVTFGAAAIGVRATTSSVNTWYVSLRKPEWVPSGRTIGLVWSLLYILMALAAWLVWREAAWGARDALIFYGVQLGTNAYWSILFFGRRNPKAALECIFLLFLFVLSTLLQFWGLSLVAGLLLVPYLAWVGFASYLNYAVWRQNPVPA